MHLWPQHAQTHTRLWLRLLRLPKYSREKTSRSGHQGGPACGSPASERPAALTNGRGPEGAPRSRWALPARRPRGRRRKAGTHSSTHAASTAEIEMFCRQRSESRASGAREAFTGGDFGLNVFGKDKYVELLRRSPWIPPGVELRRTGSRGGWGAHGIWHGMASLPPRAKSRSNMILRLGLGWKRGLGLGWKRG